MLLYYLKNFNSYYNRIFKKPSSFLEYEDYLIDTAGGEYPAVEEHVNFNPNDDVTTVIYANVPENQEIDYIVACEVARAPKSRWFVVERVRTLGGQYKLTMRRDLLADYWDQILPCPMFVEKGKVGIRDSRLFNEERITVSQVRQDPVLLKDSTGCPWVVGYIPNNAFETEKVITKKIVTDRAADFTVAGIETWQYYNRTTTPFAMTAPTYSTSFRFINYSRDSLSPGASFPNYYLLNWKGTGGTNLRKAQTDEIEGVWKDDEVTTFAMRRSFGSDVFLKDYLDTFVRSVRSDPSYDSGIQGFLNVGNNLVNAVEANNIRNLDGRTIQDSTTGIKYQINLVVDSVIEDAEILLPAYIPASCSTLEGHMMQTLDIVSGQRLPATWSINVSSELYRISLNNLDEEITTTIDSTRDHLEDQPFDMFCIPYGAIEMITANGSLITSSKNASVAIATEVALDAGSGSVYDVQILPFCPIPEFFANGRYDLRKVNHNPVMSGVNQVSALIWCRRSSFSTQIPYSIPELQDPLAKKIESITTRYRLVAPNYSAMFEFDPQKNNGVDYFIADCTYKPYTPYIRVAPNFKGLYQQSGNVSKYDARGLICTGDFSIPQTTSAWADYELANKNYQAIFDRQIQNLEMQQDLGRVQDIVGLFTGSIGAGAAAGGAAALAGLAVGPIGAGAAALSGVAGVADYMINETLRQEAIDYTRDNFGFNLGNIQALPNALAKTGAMHINNPLHPMLEVYRCTPQEYNAVSYKLIYNGFTIGSIDTVSDALIERPTYLKGQLIRIPGVGNHEASEIANELNKGVYLIWE